MAVTTYWSPNQAAIKQVETYTFTAPNSVGNTYTATLNGKSVTYTSVTGDTAALAATGLFLLLNVSESIAAEFTEIDWTNPSDGQLVATARTAGTPFANVPGTSRGLVLSTGNGLAGGISALSTTPNASPSDVNDPENWLRVDLATTPPNETRALPQDNDDMVIANSDVPLLWNLDQLAAIELNSYQRWQSFEAVIGLPIRNVGGYDEWRATHFKFVGPQGSVPAGGLTMILGLGEGAGPSLEQYDLGSQKVSLQVLATGAPATGAAVRFLGVHTDNTITASGGATIDVASAPGQVASIDDCTIADGAQIEFGADVTWTAGAILKLFSADAILSSAPPEIQGNSGSQITIKEDGLTYPSVTVQGECTLQMNAGGTITTLTMSVGCTLDKSADSRALTITDHTIDGDSCLIIDPFNSITFTNAGTVKQEVGTGPYQFTGNRTVRVV